MHRYQTNQISDKKAPKKNQMQLFQFFGTIKKIYLAEIVELTFLSQFFEGVESLALLQNCLFVDKKQIQVEMDKICHEDIFLCFLYFNLSHQRLIGKNVELSKRKINPNLSKLFLRHFKEFAVDHKLKLNSDDEDYEVETKKVKHKKGEISLKTIGNYKVTSKRGPSNNKNYIKGMEDVFVTDDADTAMKIKEEDLKNKFDFPQINEDLTSDLPTKKTQDEEEEIIVKKKGKKVNKSGWGNSEMYVYQKKDMSKKELNSLFPTLGAVSKKKSSNNGGKAAPKQSNARPGKGKALGNYQQSVFQKNPWDIPTNLANTNTSNFFCL